MSRARRMQVSPEARALSPQRARVMRRYRGLKVKNNTSYNLNSTEFTHAVYNPYAGQDVSGKMEATILAANFSMPFKYVYTLGEIIRDTYNLLGDMAKEQLPFLAKPKNQ